jgi:hypothetical protein
VKRETVRRIGTLREEFGKIKDENQETLMSAKRFLEKEGYMVKRMREAPQLGSIR